VASYYPVKMALLLTGDDILDGREYISHNEFNPFLHISLHEMAEDQVI